MLSGPRAAARHRPDLSFFRIPFFLPEGHQPKSGVRQAGVMLSALRSIKPRDAG